MQTTEIARSATANGFGIAILRNHRSGSYMVVRYASHRMTTVGGKYVVISDHAAEAAARERANREWASDRRVAA